MEGRRWLIACVNEASERREKQAILPMPMFDSTTAHMPVGTIVPTSKDQLVIRAKENRKKPENRRSMLT